jgi:hypothetical protein
MNEIKDKTTPGEMYNHIWLERWSQALASGGDRPQGEVDVQGVEAHDAARVWLRALVARFQFLAVDVALEEALTRLWQDALARLAGDPSPRAAWRGLRQGQAEALRGRLPPREAHPETPCAQYKPDLQLRLLGLGAGQLQGPVMDLGCGRQGALVGYLRQQGYQAQGMDPGVTQDPARGLWRASWMDVSPRPGCWGTVIAHQSFSLHFVYAHLHLSDVARRYAQLYRLWLEALRPGGCFAYAPGLPFIEGALPAARWRVQRRWLDAQTYRDMPAALRGLYGQAGIYSARVVRLR